MARVEVKNTVNFQGVHKQIYSKIQHQYAFGKFENCFLKEGCAFLTTLTHFMEILPEGPPGAPPGGACGGLSWQDRCAGCFLAPVGSIRFEQTIFFELPN